MRRIGLVLGMFAALGLALTGFASAALAQTPTPGGTASSQPWIGVTLVDLNAKVADRLGFSQTTGVAVVTVISGGPAEKAGVQARDLIVEVNGTQTAKAADVTAAIKATQPGDSVAIGIARSGTARTVTVVVGERPDRTVKAEPKGLGFGGLQRVFPFIGGLFDGLKSLPMGGRFERFLGQQWKYLDENGKAVTVRSIPGVIVSASAESLSIKPNDPGESGGPFAITSDTIVRLAGNRTLQSLKAGDQVVVATADGNTALSVMSAAGNRLVAPAWGRGMGRFQSDRAGRGLGGQQKATPRPGKPSQSS